MLHCVFYGGMFTSWQGTKAQQRAKEKIIQSIILITPEKLWIGLSTVSRIILMNYLALLENINLNILHWIPKRVAQVLVPRGHFGILHWDTFSARNFQKVPSTITWKYENSLAAISWVSQKPNSLFSNAGLTRSRKELPAEQSCLISEVCDPVNVCGLFQRIILSRPLGLLQYARSECYKHHASEINWNVMTNNKTMSHVFIFLILEL